MAIYDEKKSVHRDLLLSKIDAKKNTLRPMIYTLGKFWVQL